jgi:hypothetical protein
VLGTVLMRRGQLLLTAAVALAAGSAAAIAEETTCRVMPAGAWFPAARVEAAGATELTEPFSAACDVVYRIDGRGYILGGCDSRHGYQWSDPALAPIGFKHPRLPLECR